MTSSFIWFWISADPQAKGAKPDDLIVPDGFSAEIREFFFESLRCYATFRQQSIKDSELLAAEEGCLLYMGRDKHENEELIRYSWPEDVWFHVDKESSAHVYIRLPRGAHKSGDPHWYKRIHPSVVEDCCQLVKANSIKGNKLSNVSIVFTPASNLKKTASMDIGQVRST